MPRHTALLLDIFYDEPVSEATRDRIKDILPDSMPYKGIGYIAVDDDNAAKEILREHVGDAEWEYYPDNFILGKQATGWHGGNYLGKFEIKNLRIFMENLMDAGIRIYDFDFQKQED